METLLDSGKYSDLTLRCRERTWKVHRAILCTSSKVFAAMVDSGFKVGDLLHLSSDRYRLGEAKSQQEAQSHEIDLPDDDPEIMDKMLRFLYQKDYDDERDLDALSSEESVLVDPEIAHADDQPTEDQIIEAVGQWTIQDSRDKPPEVEKIPSWSEKSLLINVQVYIVADKNDIGALKRWAKGKYEEVVKHLWNSRSFLSSAKLLYDNTPPSDRLMRDVIAETAKKNIQTLIDKQDFEDLMKSHGDLAVDVLKSVLAKETETDDAYYWGSTISKKKKKGIR